MADLKAMAESLVGLTVKEVKELADILKNDYGIEAAAAAPVMMAGPAAGASAEAEKTEFDIVLISAGGAKLNVVKVVKDVTGLGLKEDKDIVDANGVVKEKANKSEAETIKKQLEEAGATVELK
jgi:large subunit ribosomal protein L7/L12